MGYKEIEKLENHETWKKVETMCEKYGYRLHHIANEKQGSFSFLCLQVIPMKKYAPHIFFSDENAFSGKEKHYEFEIQTTSYGPLNLEEYAEFLQAMTDASELVKELEQIPVEDWPILENEEV